LGDRWETSPSTNAALGRVGLFVALAVTAPGAALIAWRVVERFQTSETSGWSAAFSVALALGLLAGASLLAVAISHYVRFAMVRRVARGTRGSLYVGVNVGEFADSLRSFRVDWPPHSGLYVVALEETRVSVWRGSREEMDPVVEIPWHDVDAVTYGELQALGRPYLVVSFAATNGSRLVAAFDRISVKGQETQRLKDAIARHRGR